MTSTNTPRESARSLVRQSRIPPGQDERFTAYGVMGLPFESGHYLAFRNVTATSLGSGYRAVWLRGPDLEWRFFSTVPPERSCARYFGAATEAPPVRADIDIGWLTDDSLLVRVEGLLDWHLELGRTPATRFMSGLGARMPQAAWNNGPTLSLMGRAAGPMLGAGRVRLGGTVPNGQTFKVAPIRIWAVTGSTAVLDGENLGGLAALTEQARLGDFWLPQRGLFACGYGHFANFDPERHRAVRPALDLGRTE